MEVVNEAAISRRDGGPTGASAVAASLPTPEKSGRACDTATESPGARGTIPFVDMAVAPNRNWWGSSDMGQ